MVGTSDQLDQVFMYLSIQLCNYASMQVCTCASMQVCKYASMQRTMRWALGRPTGVLTQYFHALFNGYHNSSLVNTGSSFLPDYSYLAGLGTLPNLVRDEMEKDIIMEELRDIVKECGNNKSPGLDGLSYELYKTVLDVIQDDFLEVLQCQLNRRKIVDSNKEGVTRLASKVDGIPSVDELCLMLTIKYCQSGL